MSNSEVAATRLALQKILLREMPIWTTHCYLKLSKPWCAVGPPRPACAFLPMPCRLMANCAPTAIVVFETFGGEILKTSGWPKDDGHFGRHFYNRIDGTRYDFTADQFSMPDYSHKVQYEDILSSVREAMSETMFGQVEEMKRAFHEAFNDENAG